MWKHSISKAGLYISAFAFGYAAGHFNHRQPVNIEVEPTVHAAPAATCPTRDMPTAPSTAPEVLSSEKVMVDSAKNQSPTFATEIDLTDFDNPDEQIQSVLTADLYAFGQAGERLVENPDPLEPMFDLPPEQQLDYVKILVDSQEDSAIAALNDLILNDDTAIQNAAIEGMLNLLEMRTGHDETIAQHLAQNSVFLSEEQLNKLEKITQVSAGSQATFGL